MDEQQQPSEEESGPHSRPSSRRCTSATSSPRPSSRSSTSAPAAAASPARRTTSSISASSRSRSRVCAACSADRGCARRQRRRDQGRAQPAADGLRPAGADRRADPDRRRRRERPAQAARAPELGPLGPRPVALRGAGPPPAPSCRSWVSAGPGGLCFDLSAGALGLAELASLRRPPGSLRRGHPAPLVGGHRRRTR